MKRFLIIGMIGLCATNGTSEEFNYLAGRSVQDVTGPPVGVLMLGFVRADQISAGLHTRQYARAVAISDTENTRRVAYVVVDIAMVTYSLKREVLDRLQKRLGNAYDDSNLIVAGTHTHGAPGGFHHHLAMSPIGGPFHQAYFDVLADGITAAVAAAHADLHPCNIYLSQGDVEGASANRSAVAYEKNPPDERIKYTSNVDKTMTLLKVVDDSGVICVVNWFAVHPTSMTFFNKLITGDNKGYAAWRLEKERGTTYRDAKDFVAVFGQTNCGDVTPNLNLNNTGPGKDEVESTQIIGDRQVEVAKRLMTEEGRKLSGPIDVRFRYVDFSKLEIAEEFTGRGLQRTCASAFGYSFAAGSTEDGGGHPLFREGMTEPNPLIEGVLGAASPGPKPTEELRQCHRPKVILFAPGAARPPMQEQVMPVGLVRIGTLTLVVGPCEFTTMTGRRLREAVGRELKIDPKDVVIAGYSNEFGGYVTTFEEYQSQQYEGGHTIFGPWEESGFRQEYVKLARAMVAGEPATSVDKPADMRGIVADTPIAGPDDKAPENAKFGDVVADAPEQATRGSTVSVTFWTGNPDNDYRRGEHYLAVQQVKDRIGNTVAEDQDWSTSIRFVQIALAEASEGPRGLSTSTDEAAKKRKESLEAYRLGPKAMAKRPDPYQATITWRIGKDIEPGIFRIVHYGRFKQNGRVERFESNSRPFEVK